MIVNGCCFFGDMFCTIAHKLGCVGFVTDANGRDRSAIRQRTPGFSCFFDWVGRFTWLRRVHRFQRDGVGLWLDHFHPGDLLHGDESGLVSVPIDIAGDVVTRAEVVREEEAEYFDFLESDRFNMKETEAPYHPSRVILPPNATIFSHDVFEIKYNNANC